MAGNNTLERAKKEKNNEFYTRLSDIENELQHYTNHFRDKVVLCNCDDPLESNFFKYFAMNFNWLGLKKLICTCYSQSRIANTELNLLDKIKVDKNNRSLVAYKIELTELKDYNGDGATDLEDVKQYLEENPPKFLNGDGSFDSEECLELLKEADIVVTNPPFSLFSQFVSLLMKYNKKFLIIGSINNVTYVELFPHILKGKIWTGYKAGSMKFAVPIDSDKGKEDEQGLKWQTLGNICWYTNLTHDKQNQKLYLYKKYTPEEYPKYDNYDAIHVEKVLEIPLDYDGVMGVPITFIHKFCEEQFEIIGATESEGKGFSNGLWDSQSGVAQPLINGNRKFKRLFIRKKNIL